LSFFLAFVFIQPEKKSFPHLNYYRLPRWFIFQESTTVVNFCFFEKWIDQTGRKRTQHQKITLYQPNGTIYDDLGS